MTPGDLAYRQYSGTPLNGHPDITDSFVCPNEKLIQGCHSSEAEKFPDFSLTSGQFSLTLN